MQVSVRRTQLGFVLVALLLLIAAPMGYAQTCINDLQGPDDEPGQKDLQQFCETFNQTCSANAGSRRFTWNFDDSDWNGGNTGDACALFDTDGDGFANFSLYVTVFTNGTWLTQLYACGADSNADRRSASSARSS